MKIRIISDLHGSASLHRLYTSDCEQSLQLGDCGFEYEYLNDLDPKRHHVLGGNHDNYDELPKYLHYLGDFGLLDRIFYIRGAYSIDKPWRLAYHEKIWWEEEELAFQRGLEALTLYETLKPEIVVTHDCPEFLTRAFYTKVYRNRTGALLDQVYELHQPKLWIFGHHHFDYDHTWGNTRFVCIKDGEYRDLDTDTLEFF